MVLEDGNRDLGEVLHHTPDRKPGPLRSTLEGIINPSLPRNAAVTAWRRLPSSHLPVAVYSGLLTTFPLLLTRERGWPSKYRKPLLSLSPSLSLRPFRNFPWS